jgi:hypothetical protein
MNVDLVPDPSDPSTQWAPYLPALVFARNATTGNRETEQRVSTNVHATNHWIFSQLAPTSTRSISLTSNLNFYNPFGGNFGVNDGARPSPAHKMGEITLAQLTTCMGSLRPQGCTYHEIGMLWGLRLISREGLFRTERQVADAAGAVQRHMIFMVDGQQDTRPFTYSASGIAATARRRTPTGVFPFRTLEDAVSEIRLAELCEIAGAQHPPDLRGGDQRRVRRCRAPGEPSRLRAERPDRAVQPPAQCRRRPVDRLAAMLRRERRRLGLGRGR